MDCARHVILHYHFFKNGGSTLVTALKRNFGSNFAEIESGAHNEGLEFADFLSTIRAANHLRAVSSHTLRPSLVPAEGICFHQIFLFRDPLDRLRSMHDFYSSKQSFDRLGQRAKGLDLPSFLKLLISDYPHLARNAQLRTMCGGNRIARDGDLELAGTILRNATGVGVVEEYHVAVSTIEHHLRKIFPKLDLSYTVQNVSARRVDTLEGRLRQFEEQCGSTLYRELLALNELDIELVRVAAAEAKRRSLEIPGFEFALRDFRRRLHVRAIGRKILYVCDRTNDFLKRRGSQITDLICRSRQQSLPPNDAPSP